jgi:hypothetical protein
MRLVAPLLRAVAVAVLVVSAPRALSAVQQAWVCEDSTRSTPDGTEICWSCANYEEGCTEWDEWIWACCNIATATCADDRTEQPGACHAV